MEKSQPFLGAQRLGYRLCPCTLWQLRTASELQNVSVLCTPVNAMLVNEKTILGWGGGGGRGKGAGETRDITSPASSPGWPTNSRRAWGHWENKLRKGNISHFFTEDLLWNPSSKKCKVTGWGEGITTDELYNWFDGRMESQLHQTMDQFWFTFLMYRKSYDTAHPALHHKEPKS